MPRKYQHIIELLPQIKEMLGQGMTQKEIEKKLGLTGCRPVHELLKRERKKECQRQFENVRKRRRNFVDFRHGVVIGIRCCLAEKEC